MSFDDIHAVYERVMQLTLALYRVTNLFDADEPIRKHLREYANELLADIAVCRHSQQDEWNVLHIFGRVEAVRGLLGVAHAVGGVKPFNLNMLDREYRRIGRFFEHSPASVQSHTVKDAPVAVSRVQKTQHIASDVEVRAPEKNIAKTPSHAEAPLARGVNERQQEMLRHLRKQGRARIGDFADFFEGVSAKTIQRDLQDLLTRRMIKKEGEKRWTVYTL
jgi:hypothetical protein